MHDTVPAHESLKCCKLWLCQEIFIQNVAHALECTCVVYVTLLNQLGTYLTTGSCMFRRYRDGAGNTSGGVGGGRLGHGDGGHGGGGGGSMCIRIHCCRTTLYLVNTKITSKCVCVCVLTVSANEKPSNLPLFASNPLASLSAQQCLAQKVSVSC